MTIGTTDYDISTNGSAFQFSESALIGDTPVTSQTALSSGQFTTPNLYGESTTQVGGTAGNLAGTINTTGAMTLTAGGAGTTATGQFVTELTVK